MAASSIYWYDFESFGADPRRDRASQFAGLRTDEDLNIIGSPLVLYCKPADDFLPSPMASLITGITPQQAISEGVTEADFIGRIHNEFIKPQTCVAGYNSIRFDDELTRQLLYRNFFDPYEREWQGGNSRWDIIDMLRLCAATRPEGIEWPRRPDGAVSFRLQDLTEANGIEHSAAHDALADVHATIAMARLVRERQPKLFDYVYRLRDKRQVMAAIDLQKHKPVLHVSGMYPSRWRHLALVAPLCAHPRNNNAVIVYDLRQDPGEWLELSVADIRARLFTAGADLPEGVSRIGLKALHSNRCPVVASPGVLDEDSLGDFGIDLEQSRRHWQLLVQNREHANKVSRVFREGHADQETDPDFMIYSGGFFSDNDRSLMRTVRGTSPRDLARLDLPFQDSRLAEMLFRYRARNYPELLNAEEQQRWQRWRQKRLEDQERLQRYHEELDQARERAAPDKQPLLDEVEDYVGKLLT